MLTKSKLLTSAVFICIGVILWNAANAPVESFFVDPSAMNSMIYPKVLIIMWLLFSVLYPFKESEPSDLSSLRTAIIPLFKAMACMVFYIFLFGNLGLVLSTLLFFILFLFTLGYAPKKIIPVSLVSTFIAWFIFEFILEIIMPVSILRDLF